MRTYRLRMGPGLRGGQGLVAVLMDEAEDDIALGLELERRRPGQRRRRDDAQRGTVEHSFAGGPLYRPQ
jgi:hypothetical protein